MTGTTTSNEWQPFDVFHLPPHCQNLEVDVEFTFPYGGTERRVLPWAYYDADTGAVRNQWGRIEGDVKRWRLRDP